MLNAEYPTYKQLGKCTLVKLLQDLKADSKTIIAFIFSLGISVISDNEYSSGKTYFSRSDNAVILSLYFDQFVAVL